MVLREVRRSDRRRPPEIDGRYGPGAGGRGPEGCSKDWEVRLSVPGCTMKGMGRDGVRPGPVRRARRPEVALPELRPWEGRGDGGGRGGGGDCRGDGEGRDGRDGRDEGLRPGGDYDGLRFADLDLAGADGAGARFLDCGMFRCALDEAQLERARFLDSVLEEVWGVGTVLAGSEWRDVELTDARLGGAQIHGARLSRVLVRGGKIDFLNLRQAELQDVTFDGCVLIEPDFGGATLERVGFPGCVLRGADFTQAAMRDVDLREAAELGIAAGAGRLAGAVIGSAQLAALAPLFAAELGVRVEE